ncbi:MAG: preprotein translocase subunit YajC [Bacteroidetes bacterium GWF2_41_61]|nr:MAG: preprotein translocase subunit YajC [Bacteroidetes bacterium GWE2_40_15]OFY25705.1 MAG: preprotein translocase subunit YajC [Bacteroidetes bacterium GWF2_41_61]OFY88798.1 MAG: preprotein translocase subunit YajC [Bacteroidetes bacterium RIFOXYA12_FULL_40_10]HBG23816.1 preprotein translocase subunit YajC [Rikenellaceae bacterium]HBZ25937.1 preprotein translocase subunit YajC [Rikenellaceae bacterium]
MNFLVILQQTAEAGSGNWSFLVMMGLIFVVMYFFMIRPQQKKQKELAKFRSSLEKGDKVVTLGGIYGVVVEVKEQYVLVEVDSNVKLRIDKSAIVKDISDITAGK